MASVLPLERLILNFTVDEYDLVKKVFRFMKRQGVSDKKEQFILTVLREYFDKYDR